jgi:hypothetical protein
MLAAARRLLGSQHRGFCRSCTPSAALGLEDSAGFADFVQDRANPAGRAKPEALVLGGGAMNIVVPPEGSIETPEAPAFSVEITRTADGKIAPVRNEVVVRADGEEKNIALKPLRELFSGSRKAPDLSRGPTPELMPFFILLEMTVVRFCEEDGRDETDQEMERIWSQLRRRPDTIDSTLHSYLRAAARLYMSRKEISQAEYEAVMTRLAKSARTFATPPISRNYVATLRETFAR